MRCTRVLVTNWESVENLGDYAILRAQVGLLERRCGASVGILGNQPGVVIPQELRGRHLGDAPWPSPSRSGLLAWARSLAACAALAAHPPLVRFFPERYRSAVCLVATADVVMPEGGGYLFADGSARKVLFLARALFPLLLARRLHVPRTLWGHSIGPARGRAGRALLRMALKGAIIAVRDDASLAVCHDLGLAAERAPDLALLTIPKRAVAPSDQANRAVVTKLGVTAKRISASAGAQRDYQQALASAVTTICATVREAGGRAEVHLIPQVTGPTPREDDRPVLKAVAGLLDGEDCIFEPLPRDVESALAMYGSMDFLVATRMHSAVLAACVGTPFFVFGYIGGKSRGLVRDLGLPEWATTDAVHEIPARGAHVLPGSRHLACADGLRAACRPQGDLRSAVTAHWRCADAGRLALSSVGGAQSARVTAHETPALGPRGMRASESRPNAAFGTWTRSGPHARVLHGALLLALCAFLVMQPFIRERGGLLFWAFCGIALLHALVTAKPRLVPSLFLYTLVGLLYVLLSYLDVLPDAWTTIYDGALIPRQAFYVVLLYPLVTSAASLWSYADGKGLVSRYFLTLLIATGLLAPLVEVFLGTRSGLASVFAGVASGGYGNARLLFFAALAYFLLVGIRDVELARACTLFAVALSLLGFARVVDAPQIQNVVGLAVLLLLAFIRPSRRAIVGMVVAGVVLYASLIPFAEVIYRADPNSGYRLLLTEDAVRAVVGSAGIGVGFGKEVVAGEYGEVGVTRDELLVTRATLATQGVHNSFAQELMRLGLLGGGCLAWLFFVTCSPPGVGSVRQRRYLAAVYLALLLSLTLHVSLESPTYLVGVAFCVGYILAAKARMTSTRERP